MKSNSNQLPISVPLSFLSIMAEKYGLLQLLEESILFYFIASF